MFRTSALLIALVLAASPIGQAVCDLWCVTRGGAATHDACHDAHDGSGPGIKDPAAACDSVTVARLFVPERVQRPTGDVLMTAVSSAPRVAASPAHLASVPRRDPDRPRAGDLTPLRI